MISIWLWVLISALITVGLIGTIAPFLPGMGFIFLGILIYAVATGFSTIAPLTVIVFGVIAFLGWLASFVGSAWGAKHGGGRGPAMWGTIIGSIGGIITFGPPGLVIGAFAGGLTGALLSGQSEDKALKIAFHSVAGILGGIVMQFLLAVALITAFVIAIAT